MKKRKTKIFTRIQKQNKNKLKQSKKKNQQKANDQKHKTDYYAPIIIGTIMRD